MKKVIAKVRSDVLKLFPKKARKRGGTYCTSTWIFPNHFEPMIKISKKLCKKYEGDVDTCELACLLHDTGLVYKRKGKSPKGHEKNSLEFAKKTLEKYKVGEKRIKQIMRCIEATEVEYKPKTVNEKIVRTADILSQYYTIHFFAKAHFYPTWERYLKFLEKKITKGYRKISFPDEKKEAKPIVEYFKRVLKNYNKYNA